MQIDWTKLSRSMKTCKRSDRCFYSLNGYSENHHWDDTLPHEAIQMSSVRFAKGYDLFRFGEDYKFLTHVAEITPTGVQFLVYSDAEKGWIDEVEAHPTKYRARREMVRKWNWTSWEELFPINREFLLSLLWIPEDPLTAMEILAEAASD